MLDAMQQKRESAKALQSKQDYARRLKNFNTLEQKFIPSHNAWNFPLVTGHASLVTSLSGAA